LGALGAALALLGPGAWSVDARLFGWKRLDIRSRKN
jgi:putative oxidoreductase